MARGVKPPIGRSGAAAESQEAFELPAAHDSAAMVEGEPVVREPGRKSRADGRVGITSDEKGGSPLPNFLLASAALAPLIAPAAAPALRHADTASAGSSGAASGGLHAAPTPPAGQAAAIDPASVRQSPTRDGAPIDRAVDGNALAPIRHGEATPDLLAVSISAHLDCPTTIASQIGDALETIASDRGSPNSSVPIGRAAAPTTTSQNGPVKTIVLDLMPKHLGAVRLSLHMNRGDARINIEVENSKSVGAVASARDDIADILKRAGFTATDISIGQAAWASPPAHDANGAGPETRFDAMQGGGPGGERDEGGQEGSRRRSGDRDDPIGTRVSSGGRAVSGSGGFLL